MHTFVIFEDYPTYARYVRSFLSDVILTIRKYGLMRWIIAQTFYETSDAGFAVTQSDLNIYSLIFVLNYPKDARLLEMARTVLRASEERLNELQSINRVFAFISPKRQSAVFTKPYLSRITYKTSLLNRYMVEVRDKCMSGPL